MESEKYLPELMAERDTLDTSFRHSLRLLEQGKRMIINNKISVMTKVSPRRDASGTGRRFGAVPPGA